MTVKQRLALAFAIVGITIGAIAVWRFAATSPSQPDLTSGPGVNRLYERQQEQTKTVRPTPDEIGAENLKNSIVEAGQVAGIPGAAQLGDAVEETINAYAIPHVHEFVDWQISQGIEPTQKWQDDPDRFQSAWDTLRATFVFADIDESRVRVLRRSRDEDRSDEARSQIKSKTRPEGRPFLDGYTGELDVCEVLLPGLYPTLGGDVVETELGIEMTRRPDTGRWVITAIHHYADKFPPPRIAIPPL